MHEKIKSLGRRVLVPTLLVAAYSGVVPAAAASAPLLAGSAGLAQAANNFGKLPLRFETNQGQTDRSVKFFSRGRGYGIYLTGRGAVLALRGRGERSEASTIRMQLEGGSNSRPVGSDLLPGRTNYLFGNDPAKWHTDIPAFSKVHYAGVYPGVDLVYYGNQERLEYDFVVAPDADPERIRVHFSGAERLLIDRAGTLVIQAGSGDIAFQKPVVYQVIDGKRSPVAGQFTLMSSNTAGFAVGAYDRSKPLVIDPTLIYATYLGGSTEDSITAIAVGSAGAVYLTGTTSSPDYPVTPGTVQTAPSAVFVTKMNASGTALVYSTFLGGGGTGTGVAVDSAGEAYVTGWTNSTTFPVTKGAYQPAKKATSASYSSGFLTKISASGTSLVYSTYLGGSLSDEATSVALDSAGNAYVAGYATSADFPTTPGVVQKVNNSAALYGWNEFAAKVNPAASGAASLVYSTYLGGSDEYGSPDNIRIAVDGSGDAYVSGIAISVDFPVTKGAYQTAKVAGSGSSDMTLSKLNSTATKLLYSTYIGGSGSPYGDDQANGLAVDAAGDAYLAGITWESNFPVSKGAFQSTSASVANYLASGFVTKMNAAGSALVYSTYLSGSGGDRAFGLNVDAAGDAYVTGSARSTDFPVTSNALQSVNPAAFNGGACVFLSELNPTGAALVYSTYMGGQSSFEDGGYGVALGSNGSVYLAGITNASDFPVTKDAYETTFNSQYFTTGFVAQVDLGTAPATKASATAVTANADPAVTGTNLIFTAAVVPVTGSGIPTGNVAFSIDETNVATVPLSSTGSATYSAGPLKPGQHYILASYGGSSVYAPSGSGITENITPATPTISPAGGTYPTAQLVTISDPSPGSIVYFTTNGTTPSASSAQYGGPILVSTPQTIRAIAISPGLPASGVASASYALIGAPAALAVKATAPGAATITLNGLVNTYGMTGTYYFEYGTSSTALTASTPRTAISGSVLGSRLSFVPLPVSAQVTGLTSKATYYYRVVITTAAGVSSGAVLSFTTN